MKRLDVLVSNKFKISRSFSSKLIKNGKVKVSDNVEKDQSKNFPESIKEFIELISPLSSYKDDSFKSIISENIKFDIIFENDDILVINKPSGISVHTSSSERTGTIINGLVYLYSDIINNFSYSERPGIVHRIDKDTSGILIIAKNIKTLSYLSEQFKSRTVHKEYLALVEGIIDKSMTIEKNISRNKKDRKKMGIYENGRYAITYIYPLKWFFGSNKTKYTLLKVIPKTGRTHQIRIHLKSIGHPIIGDKIYSGKKNDHMLLHAHTLGINIPEIGYKKFEVDVPEYFDEYINNLNEIVKN